MNDTEPETIDRSNSTSVLTPEGIPGFETCRTWQLEKSSDDALFSLLRSVDQPNRSLIVAEPWELAPGYEPDLPETEMDRIGVKRPEDCVILVIVTIEPGGERLFLNLAAPIVVHAERRLARQVILDRQGWPLRHAVRAKG